MGGRKVLIMELKLPVLYTLPECVPCEQRFNIQPFKLTTRVAFLFGGTPEDNLIHCYSFWDPIVLRLTNEVACFVNIRGWSFLILHSRGEWSFSKS